MTPALASMTGFAAFDGSTSGIAWRWELRSVNGRGLELRFRLPNGWDAVEPSLRELAMASLKRGNVNANLTIQRQDTARLTVDRPTLEQVTAIALELAKSLGAPPPRAESLLALPGVLRNATPDEASTSQEALIADAKAGFATALQNLVTARRAEGARLATIMQTVLGEIAALRDEAAEIAKTQPESHRARLQEALNALLQGAPHLPEDRMAQEIALLAAKSDVREELDRLGAHLEAAHALLAEAVNIGRKFDFLVQELNREVNTLCSKSSMDQLTKIGLRLKSAVEQLREQVQNVE